MDDLDLVWVRCFQWKGRDIFTLARESALERWLTAADVREILGDELPVVAYDDSGPGGALIFPANTDRAPDSRHPLSSTLAEQLRTAIRRKAATLPCPAEPAWVWIRPLVGGYELVRGADAMTAADVRAILGGQAPIVALNAHGPHNSVFFPAFGDDYRTAVLLRNQLNDALRSDDIEPCPAESFPEPAGGESARVAAEDTAHINALRAAALLAPDAVAHHRYAGWAPGDRFIVLDPDDVARHAAALHLWPTWGGKAAGSVITRCDRHHDGHDTSAGLLIDCEGLPRPIVVSPRVLSACARKVL